MSEVEHLRAILGLAREQTIFRARDVAELGVPTTALPRMVRTGVLQRLGRGLYALANADFSEFVSFAEVAIRAPRGVVCSISALAFHQLGTQLPSTVWLALPTSVKAPRIESPRLSVVWMGRRAFETGYDLHAIDGIEVRIGDPHKTVADLFKYRSRVGLDVTLEGLRAYWESPYRDLERLRRYANIDRVESVMRPYLEMLAT